VLIYAVFLKKQPQPYKKFFPEVCGRAGGIGAFAKDWLVKLGVLRVLRVLFFLRLGARRNDLAKKLFFARFLLVFPVFPVFPEPG